MSHIISKIKHLIRGYDWWSFVFEASKTHVTIQNRVWDKTGLECKIFAICDLFFIQWDNF